MDHSDQPSEIKTRILIISDTHGLKLPKTLEPRTKADVAIHCGDLTESSMLIEYETSLRLLKDIDAPLKIVIGGNHDFTLHTPAFERLLAKARRFSSKVITKEEVVRQFGTLGQAAALFTSPDAKASGIVLLLDEGSHTFDLANGARLTVFASPFTPSKTAPWGFQYVVSPTVTLATASGPLYSDGHVWPIPKDTHLVITHGPPHGVFDENYGQKHCGSNALFAAVAEAKPRLHCFGHIHEAWGARLVTWRTPQSQVGILPSHLTHIDHERSRTIESMRALRPLKPGNFESAAGSADYPALDGKIAKLRACKKQGACITSVSNQDGAPLLVGEQTLFVNAAIKGTFELPWVVDIDLPRTHEARIHPLQTSFEEKEVVVSKETDGSCHSSIDAADRSTKHSPGTKSSSADSYSIDIGQGIPQQIQPDPLTDVKLTLDMLCLSPCTTTSPTRPPCLRPSASGDEQGLS